MSATNQAASAVLPRTDWLARVDRLLTRGLEHLTALLVVAEIVILFVGIVARYVFHDPLIWSDELASLLFLWLAMLGAALALRRSEHMRMTALVNRAGATARAVLRAARAGRDSWAFCWRFCARRSTTSTTRRSSRSCRSTSR